MSHNNDLPEDRHFKVVIEFDNIESESTRTSESSDLFLRPDTFNSSAERASGQIPKSGSSAIHQKPVAVVAVENERRLLEFRQSYQHWTTNWERDLSLAIDRLSSKYSPGLRLDLEVFEIMNVLLIELRQAILDRMDLESLKEIRLTSKSWASFGEEYLVPPVFTTLPHRDDMNRLLAISKHPKFSYRIQTLVVNLGEINEYHARHNTYFIQYMRSSNERSEALEGAWSSYAQLKQQKELFLPPSFQLPLLTTIFSHLPNLQHLHISLNTLPFPSDIPDLFPQIWKIHSTRLLPRVATTERFTALLTAISSSSLTNHLQTLTHDRLPLEFFAQKTLLMTLLSTTFHTLTRLELTIDYSEMPNDLHSPQAFSALSQCLRCATDLRTLKLGFQGRRKISISPLLRSFQESGFSFMRLEMLILEGVTSTEVELGNFVAGLKALRGLRLGGVGLRSQYQPANGGVHLREGSFRGLFGRVEREMGIERFEVMGDMVGVESGERWVLETVEDVRNLREYVID